MMIFHTLAKRKIVHVLQLLRIEETNKRVRAALHLKM